MKPSKRLDLIPPYLFAELERKIAAKRAAGIDVISLGIGDPDRPTPALIVEAMAEAITEPETHRYPSNRGRPDFREAVSDFYMRRFDVELDPATEIMPAIGAKECIFNLNLAFLDPGDAALSADPGYPVYTGGPLMAGADPVLMPLLPERHFTPDLSAISAADAARAKLMFFNYPNNPTGAVVRPGFFEEVVEFAAGNDILAVHDNAYSETVYDGYRAPSFLATPGAKDVGVEVFSWSKGYNMTGWRCAAIVGNAEAIAHYWRLKTNIDSGLFEAVQLAGIAALSPDADGDKKEMNALYTRRRDLVVDALRAHRRRRHAAEGHDLHLGAGPRRLRQRGRLLRARARGGGGRHLPGRGLRPQRRGLLPHLAHDARRPAAGGRRAAGAPGRLRRAVRYCGIDVSATPANQQLCTLHERRDSDGGVELDRDVLRPGDRRRRRADGARLRRRGGGRGRRAVRAPPRPARARRAAARAARPARRGATSATASATRCCSAGACRCTPCRGQPGARRLGALDRRRLRALRGARAARALSPARRRRRCRAASTRARCASGASARPIPTPSSARMIGHRPSPKRTPWGLQQRIAALKLRGVVDADGGLWHRTLDELDACAAAYAAYILAGGGGSLGRRPARGRHRPAGRRAAAALRPVAAAGARPPGVGRVGTIRPLSR